MKSIKQFFAIIVSIMLIITMNSVDVLYADTKSTPVYTLVINTKTNKMGYYKDGNWVREYRVATGKSSTQTPKGKFKIVNKIKNRPYYSGGIPGGHPNNPLGDRWLGLQVGSTYGTTYGIHGTNNESSIGKNVSGGCVRMYNKDVRALFEEVPTGTTVVIYSSNETYSQAAKKYGVDLSNNTELNSKQKDVQAKFKVFSIYGQTSNPIINLNDKNSIITTSKQADDILRLSSNSGTTDRQLFINAWNGLTNSEKAHSDMKKLWSDYEKIVAITEAAQLNLKLYEDITTNPNSITSKLDTYTKAKDKAKLAYDNAVKHGENSSNSKRMQYINQKYLDASNYIDVFSYLNSRDVDTAKTFVNKIQDSTLRAIAQKSIDNYCDITGHWAEKNINSAMNKGWVTKSNIFRPNNPITRAEFVAIVNNAFGFNKKANISFKDVKSNQWYYESIRVGVGEGYISGYENNTFNPNGYITREEAASIITTIKNNKDSNLNKLSQYSDANKVSQWAKSSVEGAIESQYITGYSDNTFRPKSNITRAETIVTLERVVK